MYHILSSCVFNSFYTFWATQCRIKNTAIVSIFTYSEVQPMVLTTLPCNCTWDMTYSPDNYGLKSQVSVLKLALYCNCAIYAQVSESKAQLNTIGLSSE